MNATAGSEPKSRPILDMNAYDASREEYASELLLRRKRNRGPLSVLFYQRPIEMVEASGAWMTAVDGRRYPDLYNNVPSVGHSHPQVVQAATRQVATLNTNTRYLTTRSSSTGSACYRHSTGTWTSGFCVVAAVKPTIWPCKWRPARPGPVA